MSLIEYKRWHRSNTWVCSFAFRYSYFCMHSCISSFYSRVGYSKRNGSASLWFVAGIAKYVFNGLTDILLRQPFHSCMLDSDRYMSLNIFSFDVCWKKSLDILKSLANFRYVTSFLYVSRWILVKNMLYRLVLILYFRILHFAWWICKIYLY